MSDAILVHESFDATWPFAADHWRSRWPGAHFVRTEAKVRPETLIADPARVQRLALLGFALDETSLASFTGLRQVTFTEHRAMSAMAHDAIAARGIEVVAHRSEGFWGQSVAEFGLALTLCGLRRIPQLHAAMPTDPTVWNYRPAVGRPGARGAQFGDDARFASGTLAGKRVRVVGAGNIASRYADWCSYLGAEVAAWDPFASEPCFHRAGSRRIHRLEDLVADAEIFAPMLPLTEKTRGLVRADLIDALPRGCLVVLVTRSGICDGAALRRRVLADDLALAADVFDEEPVPAGHPFLGRHNVVHTPHNAGRTRQANEAWVDDLVDRFGAVPARREVAAG